MLQSFFSGSRRGHCQPFPLLPLPPALSLGQVCSENPKEHQAIKALGNPSRQQAGVQDIFPAAQGLGTKILVMNYSPELC